MQVIFEETDFKADNFRLIEDDNTYHFECDFSIKGIVFHFNDTLQKMYNNYGNPRDGVRIQITESIQKPNNEDASMTIIIFQRASDNSKWLDIFYDIRTKNGNIQLRIIENGGQQNLSLN
jgi:hypothetical protein